jgi:hypothetical protein
METPRQLSLELRYGRSEQLKRRRSVVALSLLSIGCMALISLYQSGVIRHIPEPPLPGLDADRVDASDEAYSRMQVGDAFIGMGSYAVTAGLAAMGGARREIEAPWMPLALAGKTLFDSVQAGVLTYHQFARHHAACFWCLLASGATWATAILALPEARAAFTVVRRRSAIPCTSNYKEAFQ